LTTIVYVNEQMDIVYKTSHKLQLLRVFDAIIKVLQKVSIDRAIIRLFSSPYNTERWSISLLKE
jgi:hypothetical protein